MGLILLGLFVPWDQVRLMFIAHKVTETTFLNVCWQMWENIASSLSEHVQYYANNIIQMRRSRKEVQIDREQQLAAENTIDK